MVLIAPIDYERYAVFVSPPVVAVDTPYAATAQSRAAEEIDPKLVGFGLHEGPPFHSKSELVALPPHPAKPPPATPQYAAPHFPDLQSPLDTPALLDERMAGRESTLSPEIVTGLYSPPHNNIGETVNLRG